MASVASSTQGGLGAALWIPSAPAAASFWLLLLASGCLEASGCIPCRMQFKNLKSRFAHLCAQYREHYSQQNCTNYPWGRKPFQGFAVDELSLDLLLEKTHRVFRVIEINESLEDFPKFWDWLREVKLPEQSREALCPPACHGSASVVNCSTCRVEDAACWDLKICYPERIDLPKAISLLVTISASCLLLGLVTCALEFRFHPRVAVE